MRKLVLFGLLCMLIVSAITFACAQESINLLWEPSKMNPISTTATRDAFYTLNQADWGYELLYYDKGEEGMQAIPLPESVAAAYDSVCLAAERDDLLLVSLSQRNAYRLEVSADRHDVQAQLLVSWEKSNAFYDTDEFGERYILSPYDAIVCEEHIVLLFKRYKNGQERSSLVTISLDDGTLQQLELDGAVALSAYQGHEFLYLQYKENQLNLMRYDLQQKRVITVQKQLGERDEIAQIRYDAAQQMVIYVQGQRIIALDAAGHTVQIGYLDAPYLDRMEIVGDKAIILVGSTFSQVTMETDENHPPELTIYGAGAIERATEQLRKDVNGLQIYRINASDEDTAEQLISRMVTKDQTADLYIMDVDTVFLQLKQKGYCMDLSGIETISSAMQDVHPFIKQALYEGDALCAIPLSIFAWSWQVDTAMMEEMGISMEELPHSLEEMCDFVATWNEMWISDYPQYVPIEDCPDVRDYLLNQILCAYLQECYATGREADFLSEDMMRILTALDEMQCNHIDQLANDGQEHKGLLCNNRVVAGSFSSMQQQMDKQYLPMSLFRNGNAVLQANVTVMFVSPTSENSELAIQLMEAFLSTQDEVQKHCLYASCNHAVPNPDYQAKYDALTQQLQTLEQELQAADEDRQRALKEGQRWIQLTLSGLEPYLISPNDIAFYQQEIVPKLWLPDTAGRDTDAFMQMTEVKSYMKQFIDKQTNTKQLAQQLARIVAMMEMENR